MFIVSSTGVLLSGQTHVSAELARVLLSGVCGWCVWLVTTSGVLLSPAGLLSALLAVAQRGCGTEQLSTRHPPHNTTPLKALPVIGLGFSFQRYRV
jgi:hypothetical protein